MYDSLSPIRYVTKVKTPTLIVQSEEDHRTPMTDAEHAAFARDDQGFQHVKYWSEQSQTNFAGAPMVTAASREWPKTLFWRAVSIAFGSVTGFPDSAAAGSGETRNRRKHNRRKAWPIARTGRERSLRKGHLRDGMPRRVIKATSGDYRERRGTIRRAEGGRCRSRSGKRQVTRYSRRTTTNRTGTKCRGGGRSPSPPGSRCTRRHRPTPPAFRNRRPRGTRKDARSSRGRPTRRLPRPSG